MRIFLVKLQFLHALADLALKPIIERNVIGEIRLRGLGLTEFSLVGAVKVIVVGLSAIQGFDGVDLVKVVESDVARTVGLIQCSIYWLGYFGRIGFWLFFM